MRHFASADQVSRVIQSQVVHQSIIARQVFVVLVHNVKAMLVHISVPAKLDLLVTHTQKAVFLCLTVEEMSSVINLLNVSTGSANRFVTILSAE